MVRFAAALAALTFGLACTPVSADAPDYSTVTVVCSHTPFWVFLSGSNRPQRGKLPAATAGERFTLVSARTTLESSRFYETDVRIIEPGYPPDAHYWLNSDCAIPTK